jgi:hypothetical protein
MGFTDIPQTCHLECPKRHVLKKNCPNITVIFKSDTEQEGFLEMVQDPNEVEVLFSPMVVEEFGPCRAIRIFYCRSKVCQLSTHWLVPCMEALYLPAAHLEAVTNDIFQTVSLSTARIVEAFAHVDDVQELKRLVVWVA